MRSNEEQKNLLELTDELYAALLNNKPIDDINKIIQRIENLIKQLNLSNLTNEEKEKVQKTLHPLIGALNLAVKYSPDQIPEITALIETAFATLTPTDLAAALTAQAMTGELAGTDALYRLMNALNWAAEKTPDQIPKIAALIKTAFATLTPADLAAALTAKITEGELAGTSALYWLMNALSLAAEKSPDQIPEIAARIKTAFAKLTPADLAAALTAQKTTTELAGINALCWLMNALSWAVQKSPDQIPEITALIKTAFATLTPTDLAAALTAQAMTGELAGTNALYRLMNALNWAVQKSPDQIPEIIALIKIAFAKLTPANLAAALTAQRTTTKLAGINALYWLMNALSLAVQKSPDQIPEITALIETAFATLTPADLAAALTAQRTTTKLAGINALYYLIDVLNLAAQKSPDQTPEITALIETAFAKLTPADLAAALTAQITEGEFAGANALYRLINTLNWAAEKSPDQIPKITALIKIAFATFTPIDLAAALTAQRTTTKLAGINALYRLINALNWAAQKSPDQIPEITALIETAFATLTPADLAAALTAKITEGEFAGTSALYWLMNALSLAAEKSPDQIPKITALIKIAFATFTPIDLAAALTAQRTAGEYKDKNALQQLLSTLDSLIAHKIDSPVFTVFFNLLATLSTKKIDNQTKQKIFRCKKKLKSQLMIYLKLHKKNFKFTSMCDPSTLLGALIDHQTALTPLLNSKVTATRKMVDELISSKTKDVAPVAELEYSIINTVLPEATTEPQPEAPKEKGTTGEPPLEAPEEEAPPPSYAQVMKEKEEEHKQKLRACQIETLKRAERIYTDIKGLLKTEAYRSLLEYIYAQKEKGYDILSNPDVKAEIQTLSAHVKEKSPQKPVSIADTQHTLFGSKQTKETMRMINEEEVKLLEKSLTVPSEELPTTSPEKRTHKKRGLA